MAHMPCTGVLLAVQLPVQMAVHAACPDALQRSCHLRAGCMREHSNVRKCNEEKQLRLQQCCKAYTLT